MSSNVGLSALVYLPKDAGIIVLPDGGRCFDGIHGRLPSEQEYERRRAVASTEASVNPPIGVGCETEVATICDRMNDVITSGVPV